MSDITVPLSWILKAVMLAIVVTLAAEGTYLLAVFGVAALVISLLPAILDHSYRTNLPWTIDFLLTAWMAASFFGESGLYAAVPGWDKFLHFIGPAIFAYLAFVLIYALHYAGKLRLAVPFIGFFTFMTAMAFSVFWEMGEFWVWRLTGRDSLGTGGDGMAGLVDTFRDLQMDLLGSLIVAAGGMWYVARQRESHRREWLRPFAAIFGKRLDRAAAAVRNRSRAWRARFAARQAARKKAGRGQNDEER